MTASGILKTDLPVVNCFYVETCLIFIYWLCTCHLINFISPRSCFEDSIGVSMNATVLWIKDSFIYSFLICMCVCFFLALLCWLELQYGVDVELVRVDTWKVLFYIYYNVRFLHKCPLSWESFLLFLSLLRVFIIKGYQILSNAFSASIEEIIEFFSFFY